MKQLTARLSNKPALRAGCQALMLLVAPLNVEILRRLEQGPLSLHDLRRDLGLPPQSTVRLHLKTLDEIGAIGRRPRSEFPRSSDYEITAAGRALLRVGDAAATWLEAAPSEPRELGTTAAKSSIKALAEGWSSHLVRALAARPLSLTELNSLIPRISYPSLERRVTAMRECDLVEAQQETGRLRPYRVTEWLRQAVAPVIAAIDWERTHAPDRTAGIGRLDVEAAFLLAIPLLDLPTKMSGKCRLAVEVHDGTSPVFAGVLVCIEAGEVTSCVSSLEGEAEAWASGRPRAWLRQLNRTPTGEVEIGGDRVLAHAVIDALQRTADAPE
ncbi:MAG TPA: winged helix-turn-helix transcriptional regulator [Solirubrobacterales bacterium]|nr:winged helix-turn-helix transcriptional regulator [Solirubrobacterales bacterium]